MASLQQLRSKIRDILRRTYHCATSAAVRARRWRARHPLIVDISTVVTALVIFALLLADRQRLVQELACASNG